MDTTTPPERIVALGSGHGAFVLKERLMHMREEFTLTTQDIGVHEQKPAGYRDIARQDRGRHSPGRLRSDTDLANYRSLSLSS